MLSANVVLRFWPFQIGRELIHDSFSHHIPCVGSRFWRSLSLTEAESQDLHDNAAKPQLCWVRHFIFWCILVCWDVFISVGGRSQIGIASNICKLSAIFNEKWPELQLKSSKYCAGNTVQWFLSIETINTALQALCEKKSEDVFLHWHLTQILAQLYSGHLSKLHVFSALWWVLTKFM